MDNLVSILIPAYNAEKWIRDTIKSAVSQTWSKKEIIIVDDGSSDRTLKIAREFESKSVKVIAQENMGPCAARNKALEFAQGDYIQWLDADDLLAPDKISQQLKNSNSSQSTRILLSSAMGQFYFRHQKARFISNSLWQDLGPVEWITIKFSENVWLGIHTWLISRRLTELAGPWDERLWFTDGDGEYICRVVAASERVKFVPEAKCYYRIGNISSLAGKRPVISLECLLMSLYINHLLSLEDSKRTRDACLKLLKAWRDWFYPYVPGIVNEADNMARQLGNNLLSPSVNWKFALIKKLFGWKMARNAKSMIGKARILALMNWDRLLYNLSIE